jgi:hypothetical protein
MNDRRVIIAALLAVSVFCLQAPDEADGAVIVQNTSGGGDLLVTTYAGQSVTTPSGGPWDDIEFAFLDGTTPVALGNLFLLSNEYLGTPAALSSSTPGYIAESQGILGGKYVFAPSVTLGPSTTYYFYADAQFQPGDFTGDGDVYGGGIFYANGFTGGGVNDPFEARVYEDADFLLEGNVVPEPSTLAIWSLLGALGITVGWWRRRRRAA